MKTRKSLVTLIAVVIATLASAVERPKISIQPLNSYQLIVTMLNNKFSNFEISFLAKNGDVVYYKQSNKPLASYQKIFDVKDLENGDYSMRLKVNDTNLDTDFTVTATEIYIKESTEKFDPHFTFDGNDLKFSYLNFRQEKFKMKIYNEDELVYETKVGKEFPLHSGYNLGNLESGNYEVVLSSLNESFTYRFER